VVAVLVVVIIVAVSSGGSDDGNGNGSISIRSVSPPATSSAGKLQRREATQTPVLTVAPTPTPSWLSLSGTTWWIITDGMFADGQDYWKIEFLINREMVCGNAINPQLWNNPLHCDETTGWTWSQDEATVKWYSDGKFATYVGTVYGESMSGTGFNDWGNSWTWTETLVE